ncbi:MAG TPA: COX15/CtaA family protein [Gemmatimonadales bacterium]|nr:COX15/CtaA family protein [Gemmatimonadales bacterium]
MSFPAYARSVLGFNLLVILWGAYVRASGSGAGCGNHWPFCNGAAIPRSPGTATLIEYAHRTSSGLALILVVWLWWWSRSEFVPGHRARRAATVSLGFIITEALIGAGLVLLGLVGQDDSLGRAAYLALHLLNTFLLLAALALTALWSTNFAPLKEPTRGAAPGLLLAGGLAILVVGMTGAIAALGDTLFPSASLAEGINADSNPAAHLLIRLRVFHPVLAILSGVYLSFMGWLLARVRPGSAQHPWIRVLGGLVLLQLGVGLTNLLLLAPILLQITHLLIADLLWITLVIVAATTLAAEPVRR